MSKTHAPVSRVEAVTAALIAAGDPELQTTKLASFDLAQGPDSLRRFYETAMDNCLNEVYVEAWPTDATELASGSVYRFGAGSGFAEALYHADGAIALIGLEHGELQVRIAGESREAIVEALSTFRTAYPFADFTTEDDRARVTFWSYGTFGPQSYTRKIDVQPWAQIGQNYTADVRSELETLMTDFKPGAGGQLLLWQGPPGTGKTWALRALASEWRDWAEFHYVVDPDAFFGEHASYMVEVLLREAFGFDEDTGESVEKWRVLVLEDTGELLSADAKEKSGQGLSRLLNVVDGLIGQGLRVLVLLTTNDEIESFHPAVARPGRCASQILYAPLTAEEASEWVGETVEEPMTIAEVYSRLGRGEDSTLTSDAFPTLGGTVSTTDAVTASNSETQESVVVEPTALADAPVVTRADERPAPQPTAEVELPEATENAGEIKWEAVLLVEGKMTEDRRYIAPGATTWRELPLSLMAMLETQEGHMGAFLCGRIDRIWREGNLVMGGGIFNADEEGAKVANLVANKSLTGNSVDLAVRSFELAPLSDFDVESGLRVRDADEVDDEEEVDIIDILFNDEPQVFIFTDCVIGMSTVCPFPAFADASITVTASALEWRASRQSQMVVVAKGPVEEIAIADTVEAVTAAAVEETEEVAEELTASVEVPTTPPAEWFDDPGLDGATAITIDENGRVFGHAALWNTCHTGIQGVCTTPPHSFSDYAYFRLGEIEVDDGSSVAVGKITLGTGHAAKHLRRAAAAAHYDDTGTGVADVAAGEDEHGIWVAGALRPGLSEERVRELRASVLSGDWRSVNGNLELVAMLAVNVPGFPVPRAPRAAIVASADDELVVETLIAAGLNLEGARESLSAEEQERFAQLAARHADVFAVDDDPDEISDAFVAALVASLAERIEQPVEAA